MFQLKLKELRDEAGFSQAELAARLKVSQSTVGMWECGRNKPTYAMLVKIAALFDTPLDALAGPQDVREPLPEPAYAQAARNAEGEAYTPHLLRMPDDSMEPDILKGDTLILQPTDDISAQDVLVFRLAEKLLVRRAIETKFGYVLLPFNNKYSPIVCDTVDESNTRFSVLGRVRELRRKL